LSIEIFFLWVKDNALSLAVGVMTVSVGTYYYLLEKGKGVSLGKKYRNSIFEAQSKIFLNATQYLISGNKDLAIREFQNAVDMNRETIETYFALGRLFRSNGEIEKAISIHRSLIAKDHISESTRLSALKELAVDFDKGGFVGKAIETYRDVLKINRDQIEVIGSLCRIYEDIGDWDEALKYRLMLTKVGQVNQSETISHILVEKAKVLFDQEQYAECIEKLDEALKYAPSVSAKILKLKLYLAMSKLEDAKIELIELLKEQPMFASFVFLSLEEFNKKSEMGEGYFQRLETLKDHFLELDDHDLKNSASVFLSRVRLFKSIGKTQEAYEIFNSWMEGNTIQGDVMKIELIKLLIELGKEKEALAQTQSLLNNIQSSSTRHYCSQCGYNSDEIFWRCPQCYQWETIQFRWKV
jgi:lipopolysaccharide biosynthesis regulator YciM